MTRFLKLLWTLAVEIQLLFRMAISAFVDTISTWWKGDPYFASKEKPK